MTKRLLPWREVSPAISGDVSTTLEGLKIWQRVTDTAIITVEPYALDQLREVVFGARYMRIIGGLKTAALLKDAGLMSRSAWAETCHMIDRIISITGQPVVLLENESTVAPYLNGSKPVPDGALMAEAIPAPWNRMPLWWYPSAADDNAVLHRYLALADSVAKALPNARMVDHGSLWGPNEPYDPVAKNRAVLLCERCNQPPIELFYCHYVSGRPQAWPNSRISEALSFAVGTEAICYPGRDNWISAATELARDTRPITPAPKKVTKTPTPETPTPEK